MKSVAIIGGGITGLTAAYRLKEKNVSVTLFESSARVGGVIKSIRKDGFLAEFGPNTILETSPKITDLVKDLGLQSRRMDSDPAASNRYLVRNKKIVGVPCSPLSFLFTPLFSPLAKLSLMAEPFIARSPADKEESLADFVLRRLSRDFLDYAINPLVAGIYAGDPARLSVKHAFPKLWALEQRYGSLIRGQILGARERKRTGAVNKSNAPKFSFDHGLEVLVETLQARLAEQIRLSCPVRSVTQKGSRWTVTSGAAGSETSADFDAVLLAIPAHKLTGLEIQGAKRFDLSSLGDIYYPPVASIVLGYRREDIKHPLDGFGVLIPAVEKMNSLGVLFSSSLFPNRAPKGQVLLTCYIGGARSPGSVSESPGRLFQMAAQDITTLLKAKGSPTFQHLTIYNKAIPQYDVGYGRYKDLLTEVESQAPGLFFAGHYRDGISLGDSLVSGHDAAQKINPT